MYYCTFVTSKTARRLIQSFYEDHACFFEFLNFGFWIQKYFQSCVFDLNSVRVLKISASLFILNIKIHIYCFVYTCKITKFEFVSSPLRGWTLNSTLQTSTLTSLWYFSYLSILSAFYWGCIFLHVSKTCCIVSDILVQKVQQSEE